MNDFIGNHIKVIAHWGQFITIAIILVCLFFLYWIGRKNKWFLPKGFLSWGAALFSVLLILFSSLVFMRITQIKPGVMVLLNQLDSLLNQPAPTLVFEDVVQQQSTSITDFQGQVVLLNFWATWCAPCLKELPDLDKLQRDFGAKGLKVLAISDEKKERLLPFIQKHDYQFTYGRVETFHWTDLNSERPATFLVDKKGIIRKYFTGPYDYAYFAEQIKPYLTE